jgi:hypothetical protein
MGQCSRIVREDDPHAYARVDRQRDASQDAEKGCKKERFADARACVIFIAFADCSRHQRGHYGGQEGNEEKCRAKDLIRCPLSCKRESIAHSPDPRSIDCIGQRDHQEGEAARQQHSYDAPVQLIAPGARERARRASPKRFPALPALLAPFSGACTR